MILTSAKGWKKTVSKIEGLDLLVFLKLHFDIQRQISLIKGNLHSAGLITGISSEKEKEKMNEYVYNENRQKRTRER